MISAADNSVALKETKLPHKLSIRRSSHISNMEIQNFLRNHQLEILDDYETPKIPNKTAIKDHSIIPLPQQPYKEIGSKYYVLDKIGEGAFSTVYKVADKRTNQTYAAKVISRDHIFQQDTYYYVETEIRILERISNPYIVGFIDVIYDSNHIILVTEFCQRGSLTNILNSDALQHNNCNFKADFTQQPTALPRLDDKHSTHTSLKSLIYKKDRPRSNIVIPKMKFLPAIPQHTFSNPAQATPLLKTLHPILPQAKPKTCAKKILFELLQGLRYLHQRNIAHHDLKPENILFDDQLRVKIADFGSCIEKGRNPKSLCSTVGYAAPEIYCFYDEYVMQFYSNKDSKEQNVASLKAIQKSIFQSDIWSVGVIAYLVNLHYCPWDNYTGPDAFHQFYLDAKNSNLTYTEILDPDLTKFITDCLNFDPFKRPTVDELLNSPWLSSNDY